MRLYQMVMKVPDNFVPEELHVSAYFAGGDIELCNEGFIGPENLIQFDNAPLETVNSMPNETLDANEDSSAANSKN